MERRLDWPWGGIQLATEPDSRHWRFESEPFGGRNANASLMAGWNSDALGYLSEWSVPPRLGCSPLTRYNVLRIPSTPR